MRDDCGHSLRGAQTGKMRDKATVHGEDPNGSFALPPISRVAVTTEFVGTIGRAASWAIKRSFDLKESDPVENGACPAIDKKAVYAPGETVAPPDGLHSLE